MIQLSARPTTPPSPVTLAALMCRAEDDPTGRAQDALLWLLQLDGESMATAGALYRWAERAGTDCPQEAAQALADFRRVASSRTVGMDAYEAWGVEPGPAVDRRLVLVGGLIGWASVAEPERVKRAWRLVRRAALRSEDPRRTVGQLAEQVEAACVRARAALQAAA